MRSFSNIMPNFADKLHLLVDSIGTLCPNPSSKKITGKVCTVGKKSVPLHAEINIINILTEQ